MRVALDATPLLGSPTGVGMFTRGLINALHRRSDVSLATYALSARGASGLSGQLPDGVSSGREPRLPASALLRLWPHFAFPGTGLWTRRADLVHGTNYVVPPSRGPTVVTVHDLTAVRFAHMCTPATLRYPANIVKAVERGAHVHVLTNAIAREVKTLLSIDPGRVHVIAPGLPTVARLTGVARPSRRYVIAIGTIEPRKDYVMLLRAFDEVAAKVSDLDLVIVGAPGWSMDEFDVALARMSNRDRVRVFGRVSDHERVALLQGATALAFPSVYEGFGLPPLEAMQLDVPVVATANEAVKETAGDAALFSEIGDESAFAANLILAVEDDGVRTRLIEAGRARVGLFDWDTSAGEFFDMYSDLRRTAP